MSDLFDAVLSCNLSAVMRLTANRKEFNFSTPDGLTLLHAVAGTNTSESALIVIHLVRLGANPNARSLDGLTPVHIAVMWDNYFVLEKLLVCGGNPWIRDAYGKNAFTMAVENNSNECLTFLNNFEYPEGAEDLCSIDEALCDITSDDSSKVHTNLSEQVFCNKTSEATNMYETCYDHGETFMIAPQFNSIENGYLADLSTPFSGSRGVIFDRKTFLPASFSSEVTETSDTSDSESHIYSDLKKIAATQHLGQYQKINNEMGISTLVESLQNVRLNSRNSSRLPVASPSFHAATDSLLNSRYKNCDFNTTFNYEDKVLIDKVAHSSAFKNSMQARKAVSSFPFKSSKSNNFHMSAIHSNQRNLSALYSSCRSYSNSKVQNITFDQVKDSGHYDTCSSFTKVPGILSLCTAENDQASYKDHNITYSIISEDNGCEKDMHSSLNSSAHTTGMPDTNTNSAPQENESTVYFDCSRMPEDLENQSISRANSHDSVCSTITLSSDTVVEVTHDDKEEGVVLVEQRCMSQNADTIILDNTSSSIDTNWKSYQTAHSNMHCDDNSIWSEDQSVVVDIPNELAKLNNSEIFRQLKALGDDPGPIFESTRQIYLQRLTKLKANLADTSSLPVPNDAINRDQKHDTASNITNVKSVVSLERSSPSSEFPLYFTIHSTPFGQYPIQPFNPGVSPRLNTLAFVSASASPPLKMNSVTRSFKTALMVEEQLSHQEEKDQKNCKDNKPPPKQEDSKMQNEELKLRLEVLREKIIMVKEQREYRRSKYKKHLQYMDEVHCAQLALMAQH